ncbi:uncharacterized protein LOC132066948 [Lycium ferocissimum]|uniref:uncharacterized protein LOC132066948 n=1 Tax=Lycium ferocissimum TaxID=112874 RepID=UPI00281526A1|nr:uncharacterized protein LOC132066948 [Lycium ferocissimum]
MVFVDQEVICKKHPHHKQQPGVCYWCLRERLINLSTSTPTISLSSSSCTYSSLSSAASSTSDSPRHRRITSDVVGPFSFSFVSIISAGVGAGGVLKKSKSIAFVARGGRSGLLNGQKKKEGFWSKLIRSRGKKTKSVLVH